MNFYENQYVVNDIQLLNTLTTLFISEPSIWLYLGILPAKRGRVSPVGCFFFIWRCAYNPSIILL
jgi:hypothetical protein